MSTARCRDKTEALNGLTGRLSVKFLRCEIDKADFILSH